MVVEVVLLVSFQSRNWDYKVFNEHTNAPIPDAHEVSVP